MTKSILPEGQTDADRISDFVSGYIGAKKEQNLRAYERVGAWLLASEVYRLARRTSSRRSRRKRP